MSVELIKQNCSSPINTVEIGKPGKGAIRIGGETALPFLFQDGSMPNKPIVAMEILDSEPIDWADALKDAFGDSLNNPAAWALKCVNEYGAKAICVRLTGTQTAEHSVDFLKSIIKKSSTALIIVGSGDAEYDNSVLPKVSQALKGENCLFGIATQANYKTLTATCLADGHSIIAESPIDINMAKQANILISDMGFDAARIVMHPTTTSLGYGMEYVYSIMERSRLAAFMGDKMLAMPFILFVGQETWKTKEAKESGLIQGINWEAATAVCMLQAGADILVMRHPDAVKNVEKYIEMAMKGAKT